MSFLYKLGFVPKAFIRACYGIVSLDNLECPLFLDFDLIQLINWQIRPAQGLVLFYRM
jgi:hypothetical protein